MFSAQGLKTINFKNNDYKDALRQLATLLEKEEVTCFVLGNPKHMNGDIGESSQRSIAFKTKLISRFNVPVVLWDERLSSVLVNKAMISMNMSRKKRKEVIDEMAAINILQGYLDAQ